jgi:CheY-like chemotaxis protein
MTLPYRTSRPYPHRTERYFDQGFIPRTHIIPDALLAIRSRTVLLVEEDHSQAEVLKELLEGCEFAVRRTKSAAEGLKGILASDYDLIVCDAASPGFPAEMFYRAVERVRPNVCRRFLFLTGQTGDRRIDAFIRSVRALFVWKPFEAHQFQEAVNAVLTATEQNRLEPVETR